MPAPAESKLSLLISEIQALNTVNRLQLNVLNEIKEFLEKAIPITERPSDRARRNLFGFGDPNRRNRSSDNIREVSQENKKSLFEGGELISTSSLLKGAGLAGLVGALFTETGREFTAGILDGLGLKGVGDTFLKFANLLPTIEDTYKSLPLFIDKAEKTFDSINNIIKFFMRDKLTSTADYDLSGIRYQEQFDKLSDKQKQELVRVREAGGAYDYTDEGISPIAASYSTDDGLKLSPKMLAAREKYFFGEFPNRKPSKTTGVMRGETPILADGQLLGEGQVFESTIVKDSKVLEPKPTQPLTRYNPYGQMNMGVDDMSIFGTGNIFTNGNGAGTPTNILQDYESEKYLNKKPFSVFTETSNPIDVRPPRLFASEIDQYEYDPYAHLKYENNSILNDSMFDKLFNVFKRVDKFLTTNKEDKETPSSPLLKNLGPGTLSDDIDDPTIDTLQNFGVSPTQTEKLGKTSFIDQESTKAAVSVVSIQNSFNNQQTTSGGVPQEPKTIAVNIQRGAPNGAPLARKTAVGIWT